MMPASTTHTGNRTHPRHHRWSTADPGAAARALKGAPTRAAACTLALALAITLAMLFAPPAGATVTPPVGVRPTGGFVLAKDGQRWQGSIEVISGIDATLEKFALEGDGWSVESLEAPAQAELKAMAAVTIRIVATPRDARRPLRLTFLQNGEPVEQLLDLAPRSAMADRPASQLVELPAGVAIQRLGLPPDRYAKPPAAPPIAPSLAQTEGAGAAPQPKSSTGASPQRAARNIRVHGKLVYTREDGVIIGADGLTAHVMEQDIFDSELGTGVTAADGSFDVTFTWNPCGICETQPDIYVRLETKSANVEVNGGFLAPPYSFRSKTSNDFTGTDLNVGTLTPTSEDDNPAIHIQTNETRAWRVFNQDQGFNIPKIEIDWPVSGTSAYNPVTQVIGMNQDAGWDSFVHSHEYGHHFINHFGAQDNIAYCNGFCDPNPPFACTHCLFCSESTAVAWAEGWADWFGEHMIRSFEFRYGIAEQNTLLIQWSLEEALTCQDDGEFHDPLTTEGFLAALLRDIDDGENEHDTLAPNPNAGDELALGPTPVFQVTTLDLPSTPQEFITAFRNRFPTQDVPFWATAANSFFDLDTTGPGTVTALTSPDHPLVGDSPDATPTFTWTRATDSFSGVVGYSVSVTAGAPAMPDQTQDIGNVVQYTHTVLAPGTYFFNIRALDRAGNWSSSRASYGPFTIRAAGLANLQANQPAGWGEPVVPRPAADATHSICPDPTALTGNANSTFANLAGVNSGEATTAVGFTVDVLVDGVVRVSPPAILPIQGGSGYSGVNLGPMIVTGGRHTFEAFHDANELVPETIETDNGWAKQWIWSPLTISTTAQVTRSAPPQADGGWPSIPVAVTKYFNCDGLRFASSSPWTAMMTHALDDADDYDCRMHSPSTSVTTGFTSTSVGYSSRAAGLIDAVLVNQAVAGNANWDVGVINANNGASDCALFKVTSSPFTFGDSLIVVLGQDRYLRLQAIDIAAPNLGPVSVSIQVDPSLGKMHLGWLTPSFNTGDLEDVLTQAATDAGGKARLDVTASTAGTYCALIWRDPIDVPVPKVAPTASIVFEVGPTPPDLIPFTRAGWYAPIVPRPAPDALIASTPAPTALAGNVASTYLSGTAKNIGPVSSPPAQHAMRVDGVQVRTISDAGLTAGNTITLLGTSGPITVAGGRHTLSLRAESQNAIEEISETNNVYGEQWVWSPLTVSAGATVLRNAPPARDAGFGDVTLGLPAYFDCDGLRMPTPVIVGDTGKWSAIAVMPGASSDVDVRIHEVVSGVKDGFKTSIVTSDWGAGQSDFVLVNFRATAPRAFDVGVLREATDGTESYRAHVASSTFLGVDPIGFQLAQVLDANQIVDLYELFLDPGQWTVVLHSGTATVDWGTSLYNGLVPYSVKAAIVPAGVAWQQAAGLDETFTVNLSQAGYYCLAVWKAVTASLAVNGTYTIEIRAHATDVVGGAPPTLVAAGLTSIHPNPFNPHTTIAFEVAHEGHVRLGVYNVRGELVRMLVNEERPAGRHESVWDGRDDLGASVASGVYVAKLEALGMSATRKMVLAQ
jgi:hypothetical protein